MKTLAIDCATEACSVTLSGPDKLFVSRREVLGRGHAERLVPMIAELPDRGRADRILVSLGPGSFTGVRIGLAAARALGMAWGAQVLGYPTMSLVVETGIGDRKTWRPPYDMPPDPILACMNGGHGEWFVQPFTHARKALADCRSLAPADAVAMFDQPIVIGNRAKEFVELRGHGEAVDSLPNAAHATLLSGDVLTTDLTPIYGRGPDATPMSQRK